MAAQINVSDLLAYGEQQVGKPYVFGTAGPNTFDCSGLIQYMLKQFGVAAPHHAADQAKMGDPVAASQIQAGDLVFSDWGDGPNSHVGIATDQSHILVAPHTGTDVQVQPLSANYRSHITAVRRLPQISGNTTGATTASSAGSSGSGSGPSASAFDVGWSTFWALIKGGGSASQIPITSDPISTALAGGVAAAADFTSLMEWILKLFMPTNFLRVMSGGIGLFMITAGVFFLSRELKTS